MQTSAFINGDPFDTLTVALGSAVSPWEKFRLIGEYLLGQVLPLLGGPPPSAVQGFTYRPCLTVNDDGVCQAGEKVRLSGFTPKPNRCGAAAGISGCGIRSKGFAESWGAANWGWACDNHDTCYTNCSTPKGTCDYHLLEEIGQACVIGFPDEVNKQAREFCYSFAVAYSLAVSLCGKNAWIQGQKEGCRCCANCEPGLRACGTQCCNDSETCCAEQCINPSQQQCCRSVKGEYICAGQQTCCGLDSCCNPGSSCCERNGVRSCIPIGDQNCGDCRVCGSGQECCIRSTGAIAGCCEIGRCHPERGCT